MDNQTSDIIIVGAGVIGLACAWKLAQNGLKVKIFDRSLCGSGASQASMGVLNPPTPLSHNPLQIIHRKSLKMFPDFAKELITESGVDFHYTRCGALEIIPSDTQIERATKEVRFTEENRAVIPNLPSLELLSQQEVEELEPEVEVLDFGALYTPSSAKVDVDDFILALKQACLKNSVEIFENTPVQALLFDKEVIIGIKSATKTFYANKVLITTGTWNEFQEITPFVNTTPVRGQGILIKYSSLKHIIKWQKGYLVPYPNECVALGGTTEKKAGFDINCTVEGLFSILERAKTVYPSINTANFVKSWAGLRPAPCDRRPFMGEIPNIKNLFVCTGHYKIGFSLTPISADLICQAICKTSDFEELVPFKPRPILAQ